MNYKTTSAMRDSKTNKSMMAAYFKQGVLVLALGIFSTAAMAQTGGQAVFLDIDQSWFHDGMEGQAVGVQYSKGFAKKLDWFAELGFTMNAERIRDKYTNPDNVALVHENRFVAAAMQVGGGLAYKPLCKKSEISIQLGPVVRYQASSAYGVIVTYYPEYTKLSSAVSNIGYANKDLKTVAVGGKLRVAYTYTFTKGFLVGANGYLQNDSEKDKFYGFGLTLGKRF
ncbi:MAG: hypothetical protein QM727_09960 [Niabella sp.]